jgi:hypothetical protein
MRHTLRFWREFLDLINANLGRAPALVPVHAARPGRRARPDPNSRPGPGRNIRRTARCALPSRPNQTPGTSR